MARIITPERVQLMWEAKTLREIGYTQEQIAKNLGIDQGTASRWLSKLHNNKAGNLHNGVSIMQLSEVANMHNSITLYPCQLSRQSRGNPRRRMSIG